MSNHLPRSNSYLWFKLTKEQRINQTSSKPIADAQNDSRESTSHQYTSTVVRRINPPSVKPSLQRRLVDSQGFPTSLQKTYLVKSSAKTYPKANGYEDQNRIEASKTVRITDKVVKEFTKTGLRFAVDDWIDNLDPQTLDISGAAIDSAKAFKTNSQRFRWRCKQLGRIYFKFLTFFTSNHFSMPSKRELTSFNIWRVKRAQISRWI